MKTNSLAPFLCLALLSLAVSNLNAQTQTSPPNDLFRKAIDISSALSPVTGDATNASAENGEPLHAGIGGVSVWYKWTPTSDGVATFDTAGTGFDTILAVYTGKTISNLTPVAQNDDDPTLVVGFTSRVRFPVLKGTTYSIAVVGQVGEVGSFVLNWSFAPVGLIRFTQAAYTVPEEPTPPATQSMATISIERIGSTALPASVTFSTSDSLDFPLQATAGDDYTPLTTTVNFAAGQASQSVQVTILNDNVAEGDESLLLSLSAPSNALLSLESSTAALTIIDDDDNPPNDKLADAQLLAGTTGSMDGTNVGAGTEPNEPVHGPGAGGHTIWYQWTATDNGGLIVDTIGSTVDQATDPLDTVLAVYTSKSTTTPPAMTDLTLVAANDDALGDEPSSRVSVAVTAGTTYYIAVDSKADLGQTTINYSFATGGIVHFSQPVFTVWEDGGAATITVTRAGGTVPVNIGYTTEDEGSATAGLDYVTTSGFLSFGPTDTSKTFTVPIINDTLVEGDETVHLRLTSADSGALLGDGAEATLLIKDDESSPPNDNFAAATELSGASGSQDGTNVDARLEPGEPTHGAPGGHSIWFKWRAPSTGVVTFDTSGSTDDNDDPLDTVLAAYTGSVVSALTQLVADDDSTDGVTSRISFAVRGGVTYYIAADGHNGAEGDILLNWNFGGGGLLQFSQSRYFVSEANDHFGAPGKLVAITVTRTDGASGQVSVDYATAEGTATDGADFAGVSDTLVFADGQTSKSFTVEVFDDNLVEGDETVLLSLSNAQGGAVLGSNSLATLVILDNEDDPPNDNFANAQNLAANSVPGVIGLNSGSVVGDNSGASREASEPAHAGVTGSRSIWYRWQAPAAGVASFDTAGSVQAGGVPLDTLLAVYTGTGYADLKPVAANDEATPGSRYSRATFAAKQGTVYFIAVDAVGETGGEVTLNWALGGGGLLQFHAPSFLAREGNNAVITIDRIGSTVGAVSASFSTQEIPGSATSGADFTAVTNQTVNFATGVASQTVNVVILPDTAVEGEESFLVTLTNPQGGAILSSNVVSATVVIDDANDDPPNDTFAKATSLTGLSGDLLNATNAGSSVEPGEPATPGGHTIWFSWTAPTSGLATFSTAGSGTVAQPLDTILTVFTGSALSSLKVVTQNDNASPIDLTSRVSFAATGGTVYRLAVDARAPLVGLTQLHWSLATAGSCSFAATRYPVNEGAGSVVINVQRSGVNVNPATVKYQTIDGTAIAGSDYTATSGTLQFAAGQTAKTFSVPITDDNVNKGERTFQVQLALDNGTFPAAIVEPSTATVRIFDNDGNPLYDSFAGAIDLTGSPTGPWTNVGATVEPGEALLQSVVGKLGGGRTIWFKWTASTNGIATIDTVGSTGTNGPLDTVLAVFSGTALNNLTLVADNDEAPGDSQISSVQFQAKSGRTYFIAVDTVGDATGSIVVNTDLEAPDGDGPLLLATPTFTPTLTFKESYSSRDDLDPPGKGSFSATIVSPLDQVDLAGLNASTIFSVAIGGFEYDGTLGAGTFSSGSTRTYTLPSGATVKLAWTAKQLTVTISSTLNSTFTGEFPFPDPSYDTGKIQDSAAATIEFGGVTGARTVFAYGSASNRTTAAGVTFTTVALTGSADYKPPTVTITTPKANMAYKVDPLNPGTVPSITLTGAATDDVEVTDVEVRVNGGDFNPVTAFTPGGVNQDDVKHVTWEYDGLDLAPGLNFIEVTATDSSGTVTTTSRTVNFQTMSTITLIVDGQGTITPSFQGTSLELGKVYTITAKPSAGWIFKGWTGGVSATDLKLTFTMQDGLIVHAVFIANPYTSLQGVFNGLARPGTFDPTKTGTFTLTLAAAGSFSGKLALGSVAAISFTGSFDDKGNAVVVIPRKGQASLTLRLSADLLNGTEQITGTVSDGTFTSAIVSDRVTFDAKTNPAPQFGRYSIILSSNPALTGLAIPFGHGFLTAVVNSSGGVSLNGRLPDDTMISFSSQLSKAGVLPIYETLPNSSPLSGSALFGPARPGTASGSVDWVRGSTAVSLGFRGESYDFAKGGHVLPKLSFNGPLPTLPTSLAGGGYPTETTKTVTITTDNKAIVTATVLGLQNFTISTADGTFTADVAKLGGGKVLKLKGILLQGSTLGAGYFLNGAASGHFIIGTP